MRLSDALGQIAHIHEQLAKAEVYGGFHPVGVALSGAVGLASAVAQPWFVPADDPAAFVRHWLATAAIAGITGVAVPLRSYVWTDDEYARRRSLRVAGQFVPCIAAGLATTAGLARAGLVDLLPGLWAMLFALGVFAARPYLPQATGWVGVFFLTAGAALLARPFDELAPAGWAVGATFAAGQFATAIVLHRNRERDVDA